MAGELVKGNLNIVEIGVIERGAKTTGASGGTMQLACKVHRCKVIPYYKINFWSVLQDYDLRNYGVT